MSELITTRGSRANIRLQLLGTASALTLLIAVSTTAQADDIARPTVWIEGGYQFDAVIGSDMPFVPPLDGLTRAAGLPSATAIESTLSHSRGAEGRISFQPRGSDWLLSVSGSYGRAHSVRDVHQEKSIFGPPMKKTVQQGATWLNVVPYTPSLTGYAQHSGDNSEAHTIVDFQVGRDVGVGLLGRQTDTVVSFGARYAQLNARSNLQAHAAPDARFVQQSTPGFIVHPKYLISTRNHGSAALVDRYSDLRAIGPSLSMSNSTALFGNSEDGEFAMDWGVNAAVLFGRQHTKISHQSTVQELDGYNGVKTIAAAPARSTRSHSVTVPNLGGFAGMSYRFTNARLSAGYRADFFFGAMDRGLDTRHSETAGFHGPFAKLSIGLGG